MATEKKRPRLTQKQAESLLPLLSEFNSIAKQFLRLLNHQVETKEKKIAVYLTEMTIPKSNFNISVTTIDLNSTRATLRGKGSFNQKMDWEKDFRSRKRGQVI